MHIALLLLSFFSAVEAHPRRPLPHRPVYVPPRPVVVVRVNPWIPGYIPDQRPGWHWVDGHYDRYGRWLPGHWEPDDRRGGYVWVAGHWVGSYWVEGYWREDRRPGWIWMEGYYSEDNAWIPGYWAPEQAVQPPPPPVDQHHSYDE